MNVFTVPIYNNAYLTCKSSRSHTKQNRNHHFHISLFISHLAKFCGATTLVIATIRITTLSLMALKITATSITTLSKKAHSITTLSITV